VYAIRWITIDIPLYNLIYFLAQVILLSHKDKEKER